MARRSLSLVGATAVLAALALAPAAPAQTRVTQIADGLANPRGLDVEGRYVYVTEAGTGGTRCLPDGGPCVGRTGAVTRVGADGRGQKRITTGLPSLLLPALGNEVIGASDVSFRGGRGWLTVGIGANPQLRDQLGGEARELDWLYRYTRSGRATPFANIGDFEIAENPDGQDLDSNAQSVEPVGGQRAIADAGANALLAVDRRARVRTLAVFPPVLAPLPDGSAQIPADPVPTSVTRGPDGAYYVGQLVGFPFPEGAAKVWRVPFEGGEPEVFAEGFTHITDLDFGPDGSLYVLQLSTRSFLAGDLTGRIVRVAPDGSREDVAPGALTAPTGMDVAADGRIYATSGGISPDDGRVYRITPERR
jgi:hypothetical protein